MQAVFLRLFFSTLVSFLVTLYLVPLFCSLARRLQLVDAPDGKIKLQKQSIPYLGGIAVYTGFIFALTLIFPFQNQFFLLLVGSTFLLFLGLLDDILVLRARSKFLGQLIVALCFLKAGLYLKGQFFSNVWNLPISLLWILSVINAFNLIDVMDGLATTVALWSATSFFAIALWFGSYEVALLLTALIGPLAAFLWYNKPPASIYLGDAGSLFIGGFLATIPFLIDWGRYNWYGYLAPTVILAIPLLEGVGLIIIRRYKGIPFYKGSPDHFSHYWQRNGLSKGHVLLMICLLSTFQFVATVLFVAHFVGLISFIVGGLLFILCWISLLFWPYMTKSSHYL